MALQVTDPDSVGISWGFQGDFTDLGWFFLCSVYVLLGGFKVIFMVFGCFFGDLRLILCFFGDLRVIPWWFNSWCYF